MPFLIETFDKPGHQHVRQAHRPAHLDFLAQHSALLRACGAKLQDDGTDAGGGVYIVDVPDRAAAEAFIASDPFFKAELFERWTITNWRQAYLDGRCFI